MTNYELIKNMSIEELAAVIMCPIELGESTMMCKRTDWTKIDETCNQCCLDWLKEEAK